ncbi:MAG: conjugal transfer protein TraR [Deltaproteobacteria bacterium]|nr:conjugal transfer protein TraR [Deltaproteobacteria bacterium]
MDDVDEATERNQRRIDEGIARARARPLAAGYPGVCSLCGEESARLVLDACAPCRDKRGLE